MRSSTFALGVCAVGAALASLAWAGGDQPAAEPVRAALQTLAEPMQESVPGSRAVAQAKLKAIDQLKVAGTREAVEGLLRYLQVPYADYSMSRFKQAALAALGEIGTAEAVAAVERFEEWANGRHAAPAPFRFGRYDPLVPHFGGPEIRPEASATGRDGTRWAVFALPWFHSGLDRRRAGWWFSHSADGRDWAQPLIAGPGGDPQSLAQQLAAGEKRLEDVAPDADRDGLSDALEQSLGTKSNVPDSDADGVADGRDGNPLTPRHAPSDAAKIRQAGFTALFATTNSRGVILLVDRGDQARQEYYGFTGWVLPTKSVREGAVNITKIEGMTTTPGTAEVTIADFENGLAASVHVAKLERKRGKWLVVDFRMTAIS